MAELAALVESMLRTIDHLQEEVGEMMLIGGARRRIPEGNDNGSVLIRGDEEDDSEDQKDESEPERESIDPEEDESGPPLAKRAVSTIFFSSDRAFLAIVRRDHFSNVDPYCQTSLFLHFDLLYSSKVPT